MSIPEDVKAGETLIITATLDTGDLYGVLKGSSECLVTNEAMQREMMAEYFRKCDRGAREGWSKADFDDTSWKTISMPGHTEKAGIEELAKFDGFIWLRKTIDIPESWANKELTVYLGKIDDFDDVWFSGVHIGGLPPKTRDAWRTTRSYKVKSELVKTGSATIAVRIFDTGGLGGAVATEQEFCVKPTTFEAEPITLVGKWRYAIGGAHDTTIELP